jgi:hypothetical protein
MTVQAIRESVNESLGGQVPASSIRSYLNNNCGPGKQFKRVGRGRYVLGR